jgi:hypothetical protein
MAKEIKDKGLGWDNYNQVGSKEKNGKKCLIVCQKIKSPRNKYD